MVQDFCSINSIVVSFHDYTLQDVSPNTWKGDIYIYKIYSIIYILKKMFIYIYNVTIS